MTLLTSIDIPQATRPITYDDRLLFVGSCFSDAISAQLAQYCFRLTANPFGPLFNPLSILEALQLTEVPELIEWGGLYHSMSHHGQCSAPTKDETYRLCQAAIDSMQQAFNDASVVFITFGTAWVYELKEGVSGLVDEGVSGLVANCHKMPKEWFTRRRLTVDEIVKPWQAFIQAHPDKQFVFTVSPVRHVKDGLHQNQLSKAILLETIEQLDAQYFPSYEIVLDELRDYRFYASDLVHVNEIGAQYVFERFCDTFFHPATRQDMHLLHQYWLQSHHRLLHPDSEESKAFLNRLAAQREQLHQRFSWI